MFDGMVTWENRLLQLRSLLPAVFTQILGFSPARPMFVGYVMLGTLAIGLLGSKVAHSAEAQPLVDLSLSAEERVWLSQNPKIRLAIDVNWAPFEFVDEAGQYRGMAADYVRIVEQRLGVRIDVNTQRSWPEMVKAVKTRELDAFSLVVQTPQRDAYVNFTKPYISFPMVIVTLDQGPFIDGLAPLRDKKIAVVDNYASHELLVLDHPELRLNAVAHVKAGLESVSNGQDDAFVGNLAVVSQVIREAGITNLKIAGQTEYRFDLRMAVRKDWPLLVPILQKALDSISPQQRDEIYDRWMRLTYEEKTDYTLAGTIVFVGGLIILLIFLWNRQLRIEIEQRKKAELLLTNSQRLLTETGRMARVGGWELDAETLEVSWSEQTYHIHELAIGSQPPLETAYSFYHEEDRPKMQAAVEQALEVGKPFDLTLRFKTAKGRNIWVHSTCTPELIDDVVVKLRGTFQDVTLQKVAEIKLQQALADAEKANRAKSEFLANMSHELRTPLNAIIGFSQIWADETFGPIENSKYLEYARDINQAGTHLLYIISDILDISKIEAGEFELVRENFSLKLALEDCLAMLDQQASQGGVKLRCSAVPAELMLYADQRILKQILINLIGNSVKFTPPDGSIEIEVVVKQDQAIEITITDTGIGVPSELIAKAFEPFSQIREGTEITHEGTGLGLALARKMVELHDGTLDLISSEGGGTKAVLWFPPQALALAS